MGYSRTVTEKWECDCCKYIAKATDVPGEWLKIDYKKRVSEYRGTALFCPDCAKLFLASLQPQEKHESNVMTNHDWLKSLPVKALAVELLVFRPSDSCFEDDKKNYSALDNTWHKHSQDAMVANIAWLNKVKAEMEVDE